VTDTTTAAAIRDRLEAVARGLTPRVHADVGFVPFVPDQVTELRDAATNNPPGAFRIFQVRELAGDGDVEPIIADSDAELVQVDFELVIAYPRNSRTGDAGAYDRERVIRADRDQLREELGIYGADKFTPPDGPQATWIREGARWTRERPPNSEVDFGVHVVRMQFWRDVDIA
jgi:hypothetical protein